VTRLKDEMSFPTRAHAPSRALLSAISRTTATPTFRRAAASQQRWESTEKKQPQEYGRSFKGQLYESTAARLQREREERQRFAKQRNESAGGRNAAMTFGMQSIARLI
jgi:D-lactate dehydrogenase (cytochrome)